MNKTKQILGLFIRLLHCILIGFIIFVPFTDNFYLLLMIAFFLFFKILYSLDKNVL